MDISSKTVIKSSVDKNYIVWKKCWILRLKREAWNESKLWFNLKALPQKSNLEGTKPNTELENGFLFMHEPEVDHEEDERKDIRFQVLLH